MPINYVPRVGKHRVAVVLCPSICPHFLHLSHDSVDGSWVVRDYIGGRQIVRRNHPNAIDMNDIEREVLLSLDDDHVLTERYDNTVMWRDHMGQLTERFVNLPGWGGLPQHFGNYWEPMNG